MTTQNIQNFQETIDHVSAEVGVPPRPDSPENSENFEPEIDIEEENSGASYHRGLKAKSIAEYLYKIRDDTNSYEFLGKKYLQSVRDIHYTNLLMVMTHFAHLSISIYPRKH